MPSDCMILETLSLSTHGDSRPVFAAIATSSLRPAPLKSAVNSGILQGSEWIVLAPHHTEHSPTCTHREAVISRHSLEYFSKPAADGRLSRNPQAYLA